MIRDLIWKAIARVVAKPAVTNWLIKRAMKTPYSHIHDPKTGKLYMERFWLFNPYPPASDGRKRKWADWIPSVRIHHIVRPDQDRHLHDHPWNARTIILRGWYLEEVPTRRESVPWAANDMRTLQAGSTNRLLFGQYHRIAYVSHDTWTLFITWRYQGTWGFNVNGKKVPWREYLGVKGQS
jgi:hypothetical protein